MTATNDRARKSQRSSVNPEALLCALVLAPNQVGETPVGIAMWGHSLIVDPWGEVLAVAGDGPGVIVADLDFSLLERRRDSRGLSQSGSRSITVRAGPATFDRETPSLARTTSAVWTQVVTGARNRWARRRKLELADLVEAKWILFPTGEAPGALVEQAFQRQRLAVPRARVTTSSFHLRDMLLLADDYLTVVPACMLRVLNAKRLTVKALPVDLGIGARPVAVFTLKNRTLSPVTELFAECVRKSVASAAFRSLTHAA